MVVVGTAQEVVGQHSFICCTMTIEVFDQFLGKGVGSKQDVCLVLGIRTMQQVLHPEMTTELFFVLSKAVENHKGRVWMVVHHGLSP